MRLKPWLILSAFMLSCGPKGSESELRLTFNFSQVSTQSTFSKLVLRVSMPETNPVELIRQGPINAGDTVVFNLTLPSGEERTIEAFLYDNLQRPIFYRSVFLPSLTRESTLSIDLLPSERSVFTYELRSNGKLSTKSKVFVYSEDLYSLNGIYDGLLIGKAIALRDGSMAFATFAQDGNSPVELSFISQRELQISPPSKNLVLSGSVEGPFEPIMKTQSNLLTIEDFALVCAKDSDSLYFSFSPSVSLSKVCSLNQSAGCLVFTFDNLPSLTPREPLLRVSNIYCSAGFAIAGQTQSKIVALSAPNAELFAGFNISIQGDCIAKGFEHSNFPIPSPKTASLEFLSPSFYVIESTDGLFKLEINCISKERAKATFPYLQNREVFIIQKDGNKSIALNSKLSELKSFNAPNLELDLSIEDRKDHLFVRFPKRGSFSSCELYVISDTLSIKVDKIPPLRSHLKIARKGAFEPFGTLQRASIRCSFNGGYVQREFLPNVGSISRTEPISAGR